MPNCQLIYFSLAFQFTILNILLCIQVYINALGLLLRIYLRGHTHDIADQLKLLTTALKDKVCLLFKNIKL